MEDHDAQDDNLVTIHATLETPTELGNVLQHILDDSSYIAYRATPLDSLVEKAIHLLLQAQGIHLTGIPHSMLFKMGVMNSHLLLDRTASDAIHLLPTLGNNNPNSSLFGMLQKCKSPMGSRELKAWLRQPLVNLQEIQKRQDCVTYLLEQGGMDRLRDEALVGWPDVDALGVKLNGYAEQVTGPTTKALACLYKLYLLAVQQVPVLRDCLEQCRRGGGLFQCPLARYLRRHSQGGDGIESLATTCRSNVGFGTSAAYLSSQVVLSSGNGRN